MFAKRRAFRYRLAVRQYDATAAEDDEESWLCLTETPSLTPVPYGPTKVYILEYRSTHFDIFASLSILFDLKMWTVTIPEIERNSLGPLDALRVDISEGNNTAFYGINVDGWMLHGGKMKYATTTSFDDV